MLLLKASLMEENHRKTRIWEMEEWIGLHVRLAVVMVENLQANMLNAMAPY